MKRTYKDCDKLWTEAVKLTAGGKCEKCGEVKGAQAHHIIPRTCYPLRHDIENGVLLCVRHHIYWAHKDVLDFHSWIKTKRNLEYLESKRHNTTKNDYNAIYIYLEQIIKNLKT